MTNWKRCTSALTGQIEYINVDNVAKISVHPQGTLIIFVGLPDQMTIVTEAPHEIMDVIF